MKSKRQIEKELWPLIRPANLNADHASYVKFQREFQKKLSEQLHHNPVTVFDILFKVDLVSEDVQKLLNMEFSFKKNQKR